MALIRNAESMRQQATGAKPFSRRNYQQPSRIGRRYLVIGDYINTPNSGWTYMGPGKLMKVLGLPEKECLLWHAKDKPLDEYADLIRITIADLPKDAA